MSGQRDYWQDSSHDEHQPVTWWNGHGIYAAHLIAIVFVASMVATAVAANAQDGRFMNLALYDAAAVWHGQVWRIVTFGLVNPPTINFALDMVMLVWFGREVERYLGRNKFLILFAASYLATPLILTAIEPWRSYLLAGKIGSLAIFIAYAVIYPGAPVFFGLLSKWAALILVGIYLMMGLANRDWVQLISVLASCATAFAFVRYYRGELTLPKLPIPLPSRKPALRVLPDLPKETATEPDVDALLDKIAQSGIGSLTEKERARLESAAKKRR